MKQNADDRGHDDPQTVAGDATIIPPRGLEVQPYISAGRLIGSGCRTWEAIRSILRRRAWPEVACKVADILRASDLTSPDSRIGEILIQPAGWAEASRRWQSRIRKICATG